VHTKGSGQHADLHYSNAPHGFVGNSLRAGYNAATANLARERTLDFLA
jgi:dienelactone hydrolase